MTIGPARLAGTSATSAATRGSAASATRSRSPVVSSTRSFPRTVMRPGRPSAAPITVPWTAATTSSLTCSTPGSSIASRIRSPSATRMRSEPAPAARPRREVSSLTTRGDARSRRSTTPSARDVATSRSRAGVSSARPTVLANTSESRTVRSAQNDAFAATTVGISSTRRMAARPVRSMRQSSHAARDHRSAGADREFRRGCLSKPAIVRTMGVALGSPTARPTPSQRRRRDA